MNSKHLFVHTIVCGIICISCESHEQKADETFKRFKVEKNIEIDSSIIFKDSIRTLLKLTDVKKIVKVDARTKYQNNLEIKVKANNFTLKQLKEQHQSSSKVLRKILRLEETNNKLITQLKDFEVADKNNRINFEEKINKELKDLDLNIKEYEMLK